VDLRSGIYEQVVNVAIAQGIRALGPELQAQIAPITAGEADTLLARYLYGVLLKGLRLIREDHGDDVSLEHQIHACNELIGVLSRLSREEDLLQWRIGAEQKLLLAIFMAAQGPAVHATPGAIKVVRPETSLSTSTLFTGSAHEPSMVEELKREIASADRVDLLVSFIKWSGLRLIIDQLQAFAERGHLRVITTSYMGATDVKAVVELRKLPNTQVRISYDTRATRLHAKAYMFYRDSGFSTAYIGSSNLSSAAIGSGLEWNVKITAKDMPHILRNISATFDTYWDDVDFVRFELTDEALLRQALSSERASATALAPYQFRIEPYPFQKEILERLAAERELHGRYRNLVVAATGTGKTVMAAFDYLRHCQEHIGEANRLLFVAHRHDILEQSLMCFRAILGNNNFGNLYFGEHRPLHYEHLFISIQTFNSQDFAQAVPPDYYDFIVVDEFHHAAAPSYRELLSYYRPKILLGLTATPERMDGLSIVNEFFDGFTAAEVRLPEAINRQLVAPFQYFGVSDNVDLRGIRFERGRYEISALENLYTANDLRTETIVRALQRYATDISKVIGLGFCVSVNHAKFMADRFSKRGIPSIALHGGSNPFERAEARRKLVNREVHFIFTVDLYNEGVDIPEVNTILLLRPTESLTVFMQQLGRGLRLCPGKDVLTVLDFIGQAHRQYSFEWKFRAMMGRTIRTVKTEVDEGFSSLPRGCHIHLERIAREYILENISNAIYNRRDLLARLRSFAHNSDLAPTLTNVLAHLGPLAPADIYRRGNTLAGLCQEAGVIAPIPSENDTRLARAFLRFSRWNSRRLIRFVGQSLEHGLPAGLTPEAELMLNMFHYTLWQKSPRVLGFTDAKDSLLSFRQHAVYRGELQELLAWCYRRIAHVDKNVDLGYPCPLDLHCSYSRDEIMAAFGVWTVDQQPDMREGVKWLADKQTDILLINLNKTERHFSPTTMYEDYAINERLFHWQSQSTTAATSPTGQRYIRHRQQNSHVLLLVREYKEIGGIAQPYIYLGKATYERHSGSKPMSIVWRLAEPMPATLVPVATQAGVV